MWSLQDFRRSPVAANASHINFDIVCDVCQKVIPQVIRLSWFEKRDHLKVRDVLASAARGCHMCHLIRGAMCNDPECSTNLTSVLPWKRYPFMGARIILERSILPLHMQVQVQRSKKSKRHPCGAIQWWTGPSDVQLERRPRGNVLSLDQAVPLIWNWFEQCERGHQQVDTLIPCPSSRKTKENLSLETSLLTALNHRQLPTRLLQLMTEDSPISIKLVLTEDMDPATEYATLSYCWGGDVPCKLTKSCIESYYKSIPFDTLPRTLRDAVLLTVGLGLRYIWVDAFCIIQGDVDDWTDEAPKMSDVYGNSFLNIAADAASTSEGGLFRKRDPLAFSVCSLVDNDTKVPDPTLLCWRDPRLDDTVRPSPLYTRGWALQERVLAPRTVHFGFEQLTWDCAMDTWVEGHPGLSSSFSDGPLISALQGVRPYPDRADRKMSLDSRYESMLEDWSRLVESYSRTTLTKETDKLVAIAGLASKFASAIDRSGEEYLAGLWWSDLIKGLSWADDTRFQDPSSVAQPYGGKYRAPSWSWASIDSVILFPLGQMEIAEILEAEVSPSPFVQLDSAYIRINGPLCKASSLYWDDFPHGAEVNFPDATVVNIEVRLDNRPCTRLEYKDEDGLHSIGLTETEKIAVSDEPDPLLVRLECEDEQGFYLFALSQTIVAKDQDPEHDPNGNKLFGLLLKAATGKRGQYRRIGIWDVSTETRCKVLRSQAARMQLDKSAYEDKDEEGNCRIQLI